MQERAEVASARARACEGLAGHLEAGGRHGLALRPTVTAGLSFCADGGHAPSPPASPPPLVIAEASAPRSEAYVVEEPTTRGGASTVGPPLILVLMFGHKKIAGGP